MMQANCQSNKAGNASLSWPLLGHVFEGPRWNFETIPLGAANDLQLVTRVNRGLKAGQWLSSAAINIASSLLSTSM
jgi:hypothetical protein